MTSVARLLLAALLLSSIGCSANYQAYSVEKLELMRLLATGTITRATYDYRLNRLYKKYGYDSSGTPTRSSSSSRKKSTSSSKPSSTTEDIKAGSAPSSSPSSSGGGGSSMPKPGTSSSTLDSATGRKPKTSVEDYIKSGG